MAKPQGKLAAFTAELRRRRVFRAAAVYAGVVLVLIQIIDGAVGYLRIPEWMGTTVIIPVLLGFPIAIGLAWPLISPKRVLCAPDATLRVDREQGIGP